MILFPLLGLSGNAAAVTLTNHSVTDITTSPADCTAGFRLGADGNIYATNGAGGGTFTVQGGVEWLRGESAALYECEATVTSGSLTGGTAGSRLALSSNRDWTKTRTSDVSGTDTVIFTLAIYRIGVATPAASATITLNAEVTV